MKSGEIDIIRDFYFLEYLAVYDNCHFHVLILVSINQYFSRCIYD